MTITLYFLQASRSIRTAWVLQELGLEYEARTAEREGRGAPQWLKDEAGGLGKFPALRDGEQMFYESGNITEYLCDKYDTQHRLLPALGDAKRYDVLQWVHAAEATFALHALAILYARWSQKDGDVEATEKALSVNVQKDLDYLERELQKSPGKFLFGDAVTAADCMMEFTVDFVFARELGTKGGSWPRVNEYLKDLHAVPTWKQAVEKTGHKL
nr:glutathione s-transferase 3 [Quercus suber]